MARKRMGKGKAISMVVLILLIIAISAFIISAIVGGSETEIVSTGGTTVPIEDGNSERVLLDNDYIKVSFDKVYETDGIEDVVYLQLHYENKTDKEVWVSLDHSSVNNEMLPTFSGIPTIISAGKESRNPVFYNFSNITNLKTIEFEIVVYDNNTMNELFRSEMVGIDFNS